MTSSTGEVSVNLKRAVRIAILSTAVVVGALSCLAIGFILERTMSG